MALQTANMTDALAPSYSTSRRHRGLSAYLGRSSRRSASRTSSKSTSNSEPTYTPPSSTPSSLDEPRSSLPLEHPTDTDYPEFSSHRSKMTVKDKLTRKWGETLSPDKTYLSYYDVKLTYQDVRCLKGDWLTDTDIQFWEEFIDREILPKYPRARICLLRPAITFMLMRTRDPKSIASALPSFKGITHIFLPINDNTDVEQQGGGTHWSLLVVSTLDGVAFHYDSLGDSNYLQARLCVNRLEPLLGISLKLQSILDTPQQENGDDCGVFVCILMRHLLVKRLLHANAREKVSMSMANKVIDAAGGRKEMLKIIESLRKEADRRRSASPYSKSSSSAPPRIE